MFHRLRRAIGLVRTIAGRGLTETMRAYPMSFAVNHVMTSLFSIATAYVLYALVFTRAPAASFATYSGGADYLGFIVIGLAVLTLATGALLAVGRSVILERKAGTIEAVYLSPASGMNYFVAVLLQDLLPSLVYAGATILIGLVFGAHFPTVSASTVLVGLVLGECGMLGTGILLGYVMILLRDTYLTQNTFLLLLYLLSGVFFPVDYLPHWLQAFSRLIPLTAMLDVVRAGALTGAGLRQVVPQVLWLSLVSAVSLLLGWVCVPHVRRAALEQGGV